jgi:hypothetical protein
MKNLAVTMIEAHAESKAATLVSFGVLYGLCIGADNPNGKPVDWLYIHKIIRGSMPEMDEKAWMTKLEKIKKVAWEFHDTMAVMT